MALLPAMVLVVWTDDVDMACADLAAAGVPALQPPHNTGNNNRSALLRDPGGNLVEIVAKVDLSGQHGLCFICG